MTTKREEQRVRKAVEDLGGTNQIHDELVQYTARVEMMEEQRRELTKKYPDKWVAMANGDVVAIADSIEGVLREIDDLGISRADALVQFLNSQPRSMIL